MSTISGATDNPDWTPLQVVGNQVLLNVENTNNPAYNSGIIFCGHVQFLSLQAGVGPVTGHLIVAVQFYDDSAGANATGAAIVYTPSFGTNIFDRIPVYGPFFSVTLSVATAALFSITVNGQNSGAGPVAAYGSNILGSAVSTSYPVGATNIVIPTIVPGMAIAQIYSASVAMALEIYDAPWGTLTTLLQVISTATDAASATAPVCLSYGSPVARISNTGGAAAVASWSLQSTRGFG